MGHQQELPWEDLEPVSAHRPRRAFIARAARATPTARATRAARATPVGHRGARRIRDAADEGAAPATTDGASPPTRAKGDDWRIDEASRAASRRGLAQARAALARAHTAARDVDAA
jgi:hypothetical protein